jgi:hypothetical protein
MFSIFKGKYLQIHGWLHVFGLFKGDNSFERCCIVPTLHHSTLPCPAWEVNFVQMMDGTCFVCSHRYTYMASKELRMEAHCCSQEKKVGVPPSPSLRIYTEKKIISMDTR